MTRSEAIAPPAPEDSAARISLVGAGPGDPRLLTLAGVEALRTAEVIIVDSQALADLVRDPIVGLPGDVEVTLVAADAAAQALQAAQSGRRVVRVVAGDPFLDGRAADEVAQFAAAGVDLQVVPGISPQLAVPSFAGVDLGAGQVALASTATPREITRVFSGRFDALGDLVDRAVESGSNADHPVIVTVSGGTRAQETVHLTMGEVLANFADFDADPETPVTLIVGAGAKRPVQGWFESKPLFGWRVLVPRTKDQSASLINRLHAQGAHAEEVPTIAVEPPRMPQLLDRAIRGLVEGRYEWVAFTSVNAVRAVRGKLEEYGLDARVFSGVRIAVVGNATGQSLREWGIVPDLLPSGEHSAAGLAAEFPAYDDMLDPINRVFLPRADIAVDTLVTGLTELGWEVEDVTAYRTVRAAPPPAETREAIKTGDFDAVVFTSSSTVRNLVGIAGKPHACTIIAAIGPATAATCEEHGLRVDVIASEPDALRLADSLADFAARRRAQLTAAGQEVKKPSQRRRRRRKAL